MGEYQVKRAEFSKSKILRILEDGEWHRYSEIKKAAGVSTATLSKHLEELVKSGVIIKKIDLESGEYPYPVLYRINPLLKYETAWWRNFLLDFIKQRSATAWIKYKRLDRPLMFLSTLTSLRFLDLLKAYLNERCPESNPEFFELAFKYYVIEFYEEGLRVIKQKYLELPREELITLIEIAKERLVSKPGFWERIKQIF